MDETETSQIQLGDLSLGIPRNHRDLRRGEETHLGPHFLMDGAGINGHFRFLTWRYLPYKYVQ